MKYTAKEMFELANSAICRCPQGEPHREWQRMFGYSTFAEIIKENDTDTMRKILSKDHTLFHSGYARYLPDDLEQYLA